MVDPDHVVTAEDVADATDQSIETVARGWHELSEEQVDTEKFESESTDCRRTFSDELGSQQGHDSQRSEEIPFIALRSL